MDQLSDIPCSSRASSATLGYEPTLSLLYSPFSSIDRPIIIDDDSDSDSSVTIDNDTDSGLFGEDPVEVSEPDSDVQIVDDLQSYPQQRKVSVEAIDLTSDPQDSFNEGDYLTDACLARLAPALGRYENSTSAEPRRERPDSRVIPEACVQGILYKPGQSLELHDKSYLRVTNVLEDTDGTVYFRGRRLYKLRDLVRNGKGYLPSWRNELLWAVNDDSDVPLAEVKRFVWISFTNYIKPEPAQWEYDPDKKLFCRLKENTVSDRISIQYLSRAEADDSPRCRFDPWQLRERWRGPTRLFGDADKDACHAHGGGVIDLEQEHSGPAFIDLIEPETHGRAIARSRTSRKYTFGDGFCGAGGVSSGARKAGLDIKWGFDKSPHAMSTYRRNFKTATCECSDIFDFLTNGPDFMEVDVCHGSPPCQTFSPAKTIESASDDANFACIFSCADLMKKAKPRVLTMEETSGLYERHRHIFHRVIQGFLEIGYSVSWGMLHCLDYGVPQRRRRLIVLASG
jgi:DNA (cytosine-5)-methyltransferase 1